MGGGFGIKYDARADHGALSLFDYDDSCVEFIVEYASRLEHHCLREIISPEAAHDLADPHKRRGSFGNAVEQHFFGYAPNSSDAPDFPKAGLELKTTPLKSTAKGELVAKERLVIGMIDYMSVVNEDFEHSRFAHKAANVLLITYLYERDKNPIDYTVESVILWGLPDEDVPQIKLDWETVVGKVRAGRAEEISGSDTLYLEACTKAKDGSVRRAQPFSDVPAKPRAWALKASYMTAMRQKRLKRMEQIPRNADESRLSLLDLVRIRFSPYLGRTEEELARAFSLSTSKNLCARITGKILGVSDGARIEELEKAGAKPKTLRLRRNGKPKEAVSFPAFDYFALAERDFEESDFCGYLSQRYLFVLYREDESGAYRLSDVCFWQMPERDLPEAKRCYDQMRANVRAGRADVSVKSSENRCCHVRPHGRTAADTCPQPYGPPVTKKCFWLNQGYLKEQIALALGKPLGQWGS